MFRIDEPTSFSLTMENIALEASILTNMVDSVKRLFPSLVDNVSKSFSFVRDLEQPVTVFSKDQHKVLDKIKHVSYMNLDNFTVIVPEGFNAEYLEALTICEESLDYIDFVKNVLLKEFRIYLSTFISNKDQKISSKDITFKFKEHAKKRININTVFSKLYKTNSFEVSVKLPVVLKRNADLQQVFDRHNVVVARMKALDVAVFKSEVEDVVEFINIIIKQAQENKIESISPEAIKNISEGAHECAIQVETAAACYFRCMTITKSVDTFTGKLLERLI